MKHIYRGMTAVLFCTLLAACEDESPSYPVAPAVAPETKSAETKSSVTQAATPEAPSSTSSVPASTTRVELGVRPMYIVDAMSDSPLKTRLRSCESKTPQVSDFSIGHRGAALQFPEHSRESYMAAIRQGAGIIECDVTFTKDQQLVCRHAQNDLHTTTNILTTPLAAKCSKAFTPATFDSQGKLLTPASAECRTSDITLAEFKTLKAKMDDFNSAAKTPEEFVKSTNTFRTDLYTPTGTLMTHQEYVALVNGYGRKFTPELKTPVVPMPYTWNGVAMTQDDLEKKVIQDYLDAGISPSRVFFQSFLPRDIYYLIKNYPEFGKQAVYLDDYINNLNGLESSESFTDLYQKGVRYVGAALPKILTVNPAGEMVATGYTNQLNRAGLKMIAWTLERNQPVAGGNGWYYQSVKPALKNDGDNYVLLDALNQQANVTGVFSDWPATVTYYANCVGK